MKSAKEYNAAIKKRSHVAEVLRRMREIMKLERDADSIAERRGTRLAELETVIRKSKIIPDSGGHFESYDCWCNPKIERYESGNLVIHNYDAH